MADRSPNYPSVGLSRAIEAAGKLWNKAKRSPVDDDTAAKGIGYNSLNGPARMLIAAMRQYGLIERTEDKHFKLTDLAVHALHGTAAERSEALQKAATSPDLFAELMTERPGADDDVLRAYLVTKKRFVDEGARNAVKSFRDALDFAKVDASGYTPQNEADSPKANRTTENVMPAMEWPTQKQPTPDGVFALTVPFAKGTIAVHVRVTGDGLTAAHLARVREYIKLAEDDLKTGS